MKSGLGRLQRLQAWTNTDIVIDCVVLVPPDKGSH